MSRIRAMLFDLDGTLLDSAPDLVGALNHVRESEGLPPLPLAEMKPYASKGALGLLRAGMPPAEGERLEAWRQRFLAYYSEHSYSHSSLFEGVPELLDLLDETGIAWGVVTNKPERLTHPILEAAGLTGRLRCVVCGDTLSEAKPHPAPVLLACGMVEASAAETLFVGDDVRDIQAGVAAGTLTAAVHYGYGSWELQEAGVAADFEVYRPGDLADLARAQNGPEERHADE